MTQPNKETEKVMEAIRALDDIGRFSENQGFVVLAGDARDALKVITEGPDYIDIHTMAMVNAAIDCLSKTHPLASVDKEIGDAFEHLSIAKEKLMGNYDD